MKVSQKEINKKLIAELVRCQADNKVLKKLNEGLAKKLNLALKVNQKNTKREGLWMFILKKLRILRTLS